MVYSRLNEELKNNDIFQYVQNLENELKISKEKILESSAQLQSLKVNNYLYISINLFYFIVFHGMNGPPTNSNIEVIFQIRLLMLL
jgi:hypothetical protein